MAAMSWQEDLHFFWTLTQIHSVMHDPHMHVHGTKMQVSEKQSWYRCS